MLAYFDCFCGISGDMTLGAFIDLGVPEGWLAERIGSLPLTGFSLSVSTVNRNGIAAKRVEVLVDDHVHSRRWAEIETMIRESALPAGVAATSLDIFDRIAVAESTIHGCAKEEVHFHEVGAIDAIVDIVGTALCMEYLGIEKMVASRIPLGSGFVRCDHGTLPVPAPATVAILKDIPVCGSDISGELVTPTGAAIIASLADDFGPLPDMTLKNVGYGAGSRVYETIPNLLRIMVGQSSAGGSGMVSDTIAVVETCIDDMNPEFFGHLMERLFADGALDVYWIPVHMKKNRPGTLVQVLCDEGLRQTMVRRILSETTTTGVRHHSLGRTKLARESVEIGTASFGRVRAKQIRDAGGGVRTVPEYEVCRQIAVERHIPIRQVYETILREGKQSEK